MLTKNHIKWLIDNAINYLTALNFLFFP